MFKPNTYVNTTELAQLNGVSLYLENFIDACLRSKLNLFLQGDTGSGKTQAGKDVMDYFGDKSMFILGRNDMDTRELFQQIKLGRIATSKPAYCPEPLVNPQTGEVEWYYHQINKQGQILPQKITPEQAQRVKETLENLYASSSQLKELTDKVNYNLIVVDELPNCVPAVRAQLFNLFDGFVEIDGKPYPTGSGYSVGIATGNIGQEFTESSNDLGRALKDRMHLILDVDYFTPQPIDTLDILMKNTNPRVSFGNSLEDLAGSFREENKKLSAQEIPLEKHLIAGYLFHGLDCLEGGKSKRKLKSGWPNRVEGHESGSDAALIRPISLRAAKSILRLSQALDQITREKGAQKIDYFASMMTAFKFTSAYSGILNEALVRQTYDEDHYAAMDAVIALTEQQFKDMNNSLAAGVEMAGKGKKNKKILDQFTGRWSFMKNLLESLADRYKK